MAQQLPEYIDNLKVLLAQDNPMWPMVVERQILATLLPRLSGSRLTLEAPLWILLCLCLDGPTATPVPLCDTAWERVNHAARAGQNSSGAAPARFPKAARGLTDALAILRETGVFPRPLVSS